MSRATIKDLLSRLENVSETSWGWKATCPAHDDKNPSLSVREGDDCPVLIKCHAGCDPERILGAVGMEWSNFYNDSPAPKEIAYDYHNSDGELAYQVVRLWRDGKKTFRQRRPDGAGGWNWSMAGIQRVLYRLPEVEQAVEENRWIVIVEGEKDVDRLRHHGLTATTNPGGAKSWRPEFADHLRGAYVAIIPDNDESGREHADQIIKSLDGVATEVRLVSLPGLPPKGDASDFLDRGGTVEEIKDRIRRGKVVCKQWRPKTLKTVAANVVEMMRSGEWKRSLLWTGIRPLHPSNAGWRRKELIVIGGRPSHGKSTLLRSAALRVASRHGPVLYFSLEDNPEQVAARLVAWNASTSPDLIDEDMTTDEAELVDNALRKFEKIPMMFDITPNVDVKEIRARAHRVHDEAGPLVAVFFDYLQLAPRPTGESFNRHDLEIDYNTKALKAIARELNIAVIAASQLNRAAENRISRRPRVADLRGSGAIEQHSDKVYLIHRQDMAYDMDRDIPDEVRDVVEIELAKNRNGPTGKSLIGLHKGIHLYELDAVETSTYWQTVRNGSQ